MSQSHVLRMSGCVQGPCISTDTACSSSLVALHLAHTGIISAETVAGIAGESAS